MEAAQGVPSPTPTASDDGTGPGAIFDGVVAVCAIGALLLSLYQEWARRRSRRPSLRVKMSQGVIGGGGRTSKTQLFIEALNTGDRSVTLGGSAMIQFPRRKRLVLPTSNSTVIFPYESAPGKKCMCWIDMKELAQELDRVGYSDRYRLIGIHNDQIGNVYKSKPTNFDVAFWLRR